MRLVIQRVNHASVTVEGVEIGAIGKGYLVFLGVADTDTKEMAERYAKKLSTLRIFPDETGKTNRSIQDVQGQILVVSQFTLYADCKKGNRPSFVKAGAPEMAECCKALVPGGVASGSFGADMKVSLENDGPFTVLWDSEEW